jgi:hypothetical protein
MLKVWYYEIVVHLIIERYNMKTLDIAITNIDRLGMLLAQAADLNEQIEALKDDIKNQGEGHYEGNLYKACVTLSQRKVIDYKNLLTLLNAPADLVADNTKTTASITLKVTAR